MKFIFNVFSCLLVFANAWLFVLASRPESASGPLRANCKCLPGESLMLIENVFPSSTEWTLFCRNDSITLLQSLMPVEMTPWSVRRQGPGRSYVEAIFYLNTIQRVACQFVVDDVSHDCPGCCDTIGSLDSHYPTTELLLHESLCQLGFRPVSFAPAGSRTMYTCSCGV